MYSVRLTADADEHAFRDVARRALSHAVAPAELTFAIGGSGGLFEELPAAARASALTAPRAYVELMRDTISHRATDRFALLYDVLWRLKHGEPELLSRASDPAIAKLALYAKAVHRDIHKMHAFLRFHRKDTEDGGVYVAWFEPEHFILKRATPFFVDRFANMRWIIATPIGTALWDMEQLAFSAPRPKPDNLEDGVLDTLWQTYYRTIFNPARVNERMMTREMPRKYWHNMPETALIPELISDAQRRVAAMDHEPDIAPRFVAAIAARGKPNEEPADALAALKSEAARCTACPLYRPATQTVFGEGPADARIVFVGEQPGDNEDLAGRPFIGPAGQLFDRALKEAGIDRMQVYVTNAVKHFKFEPRGKRRIHKRPTTAEVQVCRPWLTRELDLIDPDLVIAMGATAAQALSGKATAVTTLRGIEISWPDDRRGLITVHPSYLLRLPHKATQEKEYESFVGDLRLVALLLRETKPRKPPSAQAA